MISSLPGRLVLFAVFACSLPAQQPGLQNAWDIHKTLDAIALHADKLTPFLNEIHPESWTANGAPPTYATQAASCRNLVKAVSNDARNLARNPEKLTAALETLFRIRTLETMLASFAEGIRKYQNPALADLLNAAVAENGANRDRLQQYCLELAGQREQEFRVADDEAQRCRARLSHQPSAPAKQERD